MLTFFSMPKPFWGHIGIIQRNAIQSWLQLGSDIEIILCGDEEGTAEIAREFDLIHAPDIECNEYGTPLVSSLFKAAEALARHKILNYINTDIILLSDFLKILEITKTEEPFLILGERWDLDITEPINYNDEKWENHLRQKQQQSGKVASHRANDYFIFPKRLFKGMPPFAIGRRHYDGWFIYWARNSRAMVIDTSQSVTCIHQNHDRTYALVGLQAPKEDDSLERGLEASENLKLAGGYAFLFNRKNANWTFSDNELARAHLPVNRLHSCFFSYLVLLPKVGRPVGRFLNPFTSLPKRCRDNGYNYVFKGVKIIKQQGKSSLRGLMYLFIGLALWPFRMDLYSRTAKRIFFK